MTIRSLGSASPARDVVARSIREVTPNDNADLPDGPADFLMVTDDGNLVFRAAGDENSGAGFTLAVTAGMNIPVRVKRVMEATTATVVACYVSPLDGGHGLAYPPVLSEAVAAAADESQPNVALVSVRTDQAGGTMYIAVTSSATNPTAAQVIAGEDHTGTAADGTMSFDVLTAGILASAVTGITEKVNRYAHFCHVSGNGDKSAVVASASFATPDWSAPTVSTFSPVDGSTSAAVAANLVVTFNEAIQFGGNINVSIHKTSDDSLVEAFLVGDAKLAISTTTLTINPTANLTLNTGYYVLIGAGAIQNLAGLPFVGIADKTTWNFTTVAS